LPNAYEWRPLRGAAPRSGDPRPSDRVVRASGSREWSVNVPFPFPVSVFSVSVSRFRFPFLLSASAFRFHYACSAERVATKPFGRVVFARGPREWLTDASRNKSRTAPFVRVVLYSYIYIHICIDGASAALYIYIYMYKCPKRIWVSVFFLFFGVFGRGSRVAAPRHDPRNVRPATRGIFLAFLVFLFAGYALNV
jgi:hypothetical protein